MKVTIINTSDTTGGAAVVTRRLMIALAREGVETRMLVISRLSDDPNIAFVGNRTSRSYAFLKERLGIFTQNGFSRSNLFKVSTASDGQNVAAHPWVKDADVIVLSWINQGLLSLKGIKRLASMGKPVVWMMHDMWCMTGICHHSGECDRYKEECGCCPLLQSTKPGDLSHRVWKRKNRLYEPGNIHFVAVSNWLADKCRESSLLGRQDVTVIHNPFPVASFHYEPHKELKMAALDYNKNIILMGAARLDDPIKGIDYAIDALNLLFAENPELITTTQMVFFGSVRDRSVFDRLNFPFQLLGTINDPKVLRELFASAKVVLSTSLYETLPGTLIEGQAAGAIPVTFGRGGQADIVDHLKSGYIADYLNPRSVAEGLRWALSADIPREQLHEQVRERFSSQLIARKYIALFNHLLAQQPR